jgi:hypothetical protein
MKFILKISNQIFCLLLMVHLLAVNIQLKSYLELISQTNMSKDFDVEEETESKSNKTESQSSEKEISDSEIDNYIENFGHNYPNSINLGLNKNIKKNYQDNKCTLPIVHFDIQSPPPRV